MEVLVVDDDAQVRKMLIDMLPYCGCKGIPATNGVEALNIMKGKIFPVIISDIRMPGMDGIELLKEIKKKR